MTHWISFTEIKTIFNVIINDDMRSSYLKVFISVYRGPSHLEIEDIIVNP